MHRKKDVKSTHYEIEIRGNILKLMSLFITLFVSFQVFSKEYVCMSDSEAVLNQCKQLYPYDKNNELCDSEGKSLRAYILTDACNHYGVDENEVLPATCLLAEVATKNNCELWHYTPARNFCGKNYGEQYLTFLTSKTCNQELADKEFGFVSDLDKIQPKIDHLFSLISLMDRSPLDKNFSQFMSMRPVISKDWNHPMTQKMITLMKELNQEIQERSFLKIKAGTESYYDLILGAHQYMALLSRVYTLYAFIAHKEEKLLKSFDDLRDLNLVISEKLYSLLLADKTYPALARVHSTVEIGLKETDKQTAEYNALKSPHSKEEYTKLIQFMGLRENMHNLWGVNDLTEMNLLSQRLPRCHQTLSFNDSGAISGFSAVDENLRYDYFYEVYIKNISLLDETLRAIPLLTQNDFGLIKEIYEKSDEFKKEVILFFEDENINEELIHSHLTENFKHLRYYIQDKWNLTLNNQLKILLLPSDMNKSIKQQASIIMRKIEDLIIESFTEGLQGQYPFLSQSGLISIGKRVKEYFTAWSDLQYEQKNKIIETLNKIKQQELTPAQKLEKRVDEIFKKLSENELVLSSWEKTYSVERYDAPVIRNSKEILFLLKQRAQKRDSHFYSAFIDGDERTKKIQEFIIKLDKELNKTYPDDIKLISSHQDENMNKEIVDLLKKEFSETGYKLTKEYQIKKKDVFSFEASGEKIHFLDIYEALEESLYIEIDKTKSVYRLNQLLGIELPKMDERIDYMTSVQKIEDLYFLSLDYTTAELSYYRKNKKEQVRKFSNIEFFELLLNGTKYLALDKNEQRELINWRLENLGLEDLFLTMNTSRIEKVKKVYFAHKNSSKASIYFGDEVKTRPIIEHMAISLRSQGKLNKAFLKEMISEVLTNASVNIKKTINDFCIASYTDNKDAFKKAFKASVALRNSIKEEKDRIYRGTQVEDFDNELDDELRTNLEAINDDVLMPILIGMGVFALVLYLGSPLGWWSVPGVIASLGITPMMVSLSSLSMVTLIVFTTSVHLNKNFYTIPAQLKYQEKLVSTQVLSQKLISGKLIKGQGESNILDVLISVGLIPFDLFYVGSVVRTFKKEMGIYGIKAVQELTGLKGTVKEPRDIGSVTSLKSRMKQRYDSYLKRNKQIKPLWLGDDLLRFGLNRAMLNAELTLPKLKKQMQALKKRWMNKLDFFEEVDELTGEQKINWVLAREEGLEFLKIKQGNPVSYWLKSEIKAIKSGSYREFKKLNGNKAEELRALREEALENEIVQLESFIEKIDHISSNDIAHSEKLLAFLRELSEGELSKLNDYIKFDGEGFDLIFKEYAKVKDLDSHYLAENPYLDDLKKQRSVYITDPQDFDEDVKLFNEFLIHITR